MQTRRTWFTETARRAYVFGSTGKLLPKFTDRVFALAGGLALADLGFTRAALKDPDIIGDPIACYPGDCGNGTGCCETDLGCFEEVGRPGCWSTGKAHECCCDYYCHETPEDGSYECTKIEAC